MGADFLKLSAGDFDEARVSLSDLVRLVAALALPINHIFSDGSSLAEHMISGVKDRDKQLLLAKRLLQGGVGANTEIVIDGRRGTLGSWVEMEEGYINGELVMPDFEG